ncbi:MAG: hypothetical protein IKU53_04765 [Firmicutes bacterium]|nr:hypothetical protein [Bacillota bacterium]
MKAVKTISAKKDVFAPKEGVKLGKQENPVLVEGVSGAETYLSSLVADSGKEFEFYHKSTIYIRDKKLGIEYDLKNYSVKDKEEQKEICTVWFNTYGTENCTKCLEGFKFKDE